MRTAVVIAAGAYADGCALYAHDPWTGVVRLARHRGLSGPFVEVLADTGDLSPCTAALRTGESVLVDDLTAGPVFPGRDSLVADAFRAMYCHPLHDERGGLLGVLVLYFRDAGPHPGGRRLARAASQAMAQVRMTAPPH